MAEISSLESRNVLRNLVKMSLSSIAYLRNLFDESVFEDAVFGGMPMKCLTRVLPESSTLLDWIDYGIYDALSKSFLKSLVIGIHDASNQILEAYTFHLQYNDEWNTSVYPSAADGSRGSDDRDGIDFRRDHIKAQTVNTLRNLILLLQSLSPFLDDSFISMKILYNSNVEEDYEPQYFQRDRLSEDLHQVKFNTNQIIGSVNTGYHVMCIELNTTSLIDELSAELPEADPPEAKGEVIRRAVCKTNRREWKSRCNGNTIHDCLTLAISPEVTSTVGCPADSSSNYLSLKSRATPGDRGDEEGCGWTSSGLPVADLREAEGEINRGSCLQDNERTSGRTSSMRKGSLADVGLYKSLGINGKRQFYSTRNLGVGNMDKTEGAIAGDGIEDTAPERWYK